MQQRPDIQPSDRMLSWFGGCATMPRSPEPYNSHNMREHYISVDRIRRALSIALLALPVVVQAQVALYSFSETV